MNNIKKITYIKILSAIFISIVIAGVLNSQIYLSNSPKIRPDFGSNLIANLKNLIETPFSFFANNPENKSEVPYKQIIKEVPYKQIAKGVYAKEQDNTTYKLYKNDEIEWLEYQFESKGKKYVIRYAKGDIMPKKELILKLYE